MAALKLTNEQRVALFDRLAETAAERALEFQEKRPGLASWYADIALHYDRAARKIEKLIEEETAGR